MVFAVSVTFYWGFPGCVCVLIYGPNIYIFFSDGEKVWQHGCGDHHLQSGRIQSSDSQSPLWNLNCLQPIKVESWEESYFLRWHFDRSKVWLACTELYDGPNIDLDYASLRTINECSKQSPNSDFSQFTLFMVRHLVHDLLLLPKSTDRNQISNRDSICTHW